MISRGSALRAVRIAAGYACAVAVATIVTVGVQILRVTVIDGEAWVSPAGLLGDLMPLLFFGALITSITAAPGFLGTVWLGRVLRQRGWPFFAFMGALDVFPACALFEAMSRPDYLEPGGMLFSEFPLICLPGGFVGGFVYWFVAHRVFVRADASTSTGSV